MAFVSNCIREGEDVGEKGVWTGCRRSYREHGEGLSSRQMHCIVWAGCKAGNDLLGGAVLVPMTVLVIVEGDAATVTVGTALVPVMSFVVVWRDQKFSRGEKRFKYLYVGSRVFKAGKQSNWFLDTYSSRGRRKVCRDHR